MLATAVVPQAARAQEAELPFHGARTGELAKLCGGTVKGVPTAAAVAYCQGFFIAAGQYHRELTAEGGAQRPIYCLPEPSPTFDEARRAFVAWVGANPRYADDLSIDGLLRFAAESYPCPVQPPATRRRR